MLLLPFLIPAAPQSSQIYNVLFCQQHMHICRPVHLVIVKHMTEIARGDEMAASVPSLLLDADGRGGRGGTRGTGKAAVAMLVLSSTSMVEAAEAPVI
jgi:hypothetical protein